MGNIEINVSLPLDDDGYFRRECPFCRKEFKVMLTKEEMATIAQKGIDSFMSESNEKTDSEQSDSEESYRFCPYCGQSAENDSWWTQEQLSYIGIFAKNIMANLVNEQLIRPLQRNFGQHRSGPFSLSFKGHEMEQQEPWISPETNDMDVFDLPCCNRKIKIEENTKAPMYCFFCGFPHERTDKTN